jgi:hypothetical protein
MAHEDDPKASAAIDCDGEGAIAGAAQSQLVRYQAEKRAHGRVEHGPGLAAVVAARAWCVIDRRIARIHQDDFRGKVSGGPLEGFLETTATVEAGKNRAAFGAYREDYRRAGLDEDVLGTDVGLALPTGAAVGAEKDPVAVVAAVVRPVGGEQHGRLVSRVGANDV